MSRRGLRLAGLSVAAIALGVAVLLLTRIEPPGEVETPAITDSGSPAQHSTESGAVVPGLALEPGPASATLAAVLTPSTGLTRIESIASGATAALTPDATPPASPTRPSDATPDNSAGAS